MGARRKPGPASPANMSKRGLSARHSVPNQTLSLVNFRLPKGNPTAGNQGRTGGYGGHGPGFHAPGGGVPARRLALGGGLHLCPVGWVERSDTHRCRCVWRWVSLRSTHPTQTQLRDLAARTARGLPETSRPLCQRAQGRPGARCTRGLACNVHRRTRTRAYRFSGNTPAFPAQWLYGLLRALPGERLSCHHRPREASLLPDLAPAPRRQDHTTSPYASGAYVYRAICVHRISPHVRDDGQRPSSAVRRAELCR
jgi:hypothetical protein